MRNFGIALIAAAALCVASPAVANLFGGDTTDNSINNSAQGGQGGNGTGVGVGIGQGGNAGANSDSGVFGSGNSRVGVGPVGNNSGNSHTDVNNRNSNAAFSGVDFEDATFGNSSNSNSNTLGQQQGQIQGQKQGQINAQGQDTDQANKQTTKIDASDRSVTTIEASDIPVASAAPVFASACSAGVSGQSMGFGGSLATTNPMCDMALAAEMARAVGNDELAYELTLEAARFARARTNVVRRFGQWIPFVGSLW
jgi:hypothetical protein